MCVCENVYIMMFTAALFIVYNLKKFKCLVTFGLVHHNQFPMPRSTEELVK